MIRLAARMVVAGGREPLARLVVTALGVGIGVTLLLLAAAGFPALHAHDVRGGWTHTTAHNIKPAQDESRTDPLLMELSGDSFEGKEITQVNVAALGPRAPVPPGLDRLPGPAEIAVSPAMARLLASTPRDMLADRYPGRIVETVGNAALVGPESLVIFVGYDPARLRATGDAEEVHSIEAAPVQHGTSQFSRVVLLIGMIGLLLPVVVFVGTATRLAAARREQRLAALLLVGATRSQLGILAAMEAALAAAAGTVLGFAAFAVTRPYVAGIPFDGYSFFPADLRLSPAMAALVAFGVPALGIVAAIVSLRRVTMSPLGVTRQASRPRPTWRRLVLVGLGLAGFAIALPMAVTAHGDLGPAVLAVTFVVVVLGIIVAGPWLTIVVARIMARFGRRAPMMLAARRLQGDPGAGFRSISGLILAVFVASLINGVTPGLERDAYAQGKGGLMLPAESVAAIYTYGGRSNGADAAQTAPLMRRLAVTSGVSGVLDLRTGPPGSAAVNIQGDPTSAFAPILARCADLRRTHTADCPDPAAVVAVPDPHEGTVRRSARALDHPLPIAAFEELPLAELVAVTDGRPATMERVRTMMKSVTPAVNPDVNTTADFDAAQRHNLSTLRRMTTVALLLTLLIAGCSLAVSVAGGLVERKRPLTLLRLAGARPADLHRVAIAEMAPLLLAVAAVSAGLGLSMSVLILNAGHTSWLPPAPGYWAALVGGLLVALLIAASAAIGLLGRLTSPQHARFE